MSPSPPARPREKAQVLDEAAFDRALTRIAHEILEKNDGAKELAFVGLRTRGVDIARRLAEKIVRIDGSTVPVGTLDITLYRDDLDTGLEKPMLGVTELPFALEGTGIVLVDDVLFTGRTVRAALGVFHDYGRPRWVKLAVLLDRGGRELPIQPDWVGRKVQAARGDRVVVVAGEAPSPDDRVFVEPGGLR